MERSGGEESHERRRKRRDACGPREGALGTAAAVTVETWLERVDSGYVGMYMGLGTEVGKFYGSYRESRQGGKFVF